MRPLCTCPHEETAFLANQNMVSEDSDRLCESGPEVIKLFSCSTQLTMKFSLLRNMKMPTIVGIFIFISREIFMLSLV